MQEGLPKGGVGVSLADQGFSSGEQGIKQGFPKAAGVELLYFNNFSVGTNPFYVLQVNNTYALSDSFSKVIGAHTSRMALRNRGPSVWPRSIAICAASVNVSPCCSAALPASIMQPATTIVKIAPINVSSRAHNFVVSYNYDLPFGTLFRAHNRLTLGWAISGISRFFTGLPVSFVSLGDNYLVQAQNNGINAFSIDLPDVQPGKLNINHDTSGAPDRRSPALSRSALPSPNFRGLHHGLLV